MIRPVLTAVICLGIGFGFGRMTPDRRPTRSQLPLPEKVERIEIPSGRLLTTHTTTAYDRDAPDLKMRLRECPNNAADPTMYRLTYPDGRVAIVNSVRLQPDESPDGRERPE